MDVYTVTEYNYDTKDFQPWRRTFTDLLLALDHIKDFAAAAPAGYTFDVLPTDDGITTRAALFDGTTMYLEYRITKTTLIKE